MVHCYFNGWNSLRSYYGYVFNAPTLWNFDFSMQMYGAILMMSGAYCLATESHVRGDVIYRLFKPRDKGG